MNQRCQFVVELCTSDGVLTLLIMTFKAASEPVVNPGRDFVPINVLRPRATRVRQWTHRIVPLCAFIGAVVGGTSAYNEHKPSHRSGKISAARFTGVVAGNAVVSGLAGGAAAYGGALAYSAVGGASGVVVGLGAAAIAGFTAHSTPGFLSTAYLIAQQNRMDEVALQNAAPVGPKPHMMRAIADFGDVQSPNASGSELTDQARKRKEYQFASPPFTGPWNDEVLYIGMNKGAAPRAVRRMQSQGAKVTLVTDAAQQDKVRFNSRVYSLNSDAGIAAFAGSLGLPAAQTQGVMVAMKACEKDARDELAQIAIKWLRAERGGIIPSRLVLAGHSNGDGVWGDNNGSLRLGPLRLLAQAMPRAARQVEDAFVTGCYSGGEVTMEQYGLILPQAKTIWAYEVQAPGVDNGGALDQAGWEIATRGRRADAMPAQGSLVRKNMAVWSAVRGYIAVKPPLTMNQLRGKVQWMQNRYFSPAFVGQTNTRVDGYNIPIGMTDPQTGLVRQYYSWLCRLTQHRDLPEDERVMWNQRKHQAIRLIYYSATVAPRFAKHHAEDIRRGYAAVGMTPPDYSRLPRAQALVHIKRFANEVKQMPKAPQDAVKLVGLLQQGLNQLDPEVIADGWV